MQVIVTTDFFGSFWPHRTSYGSLPGAHSLIDTVERMRAEDPATVWIDTGDFAQGGPLAPIGTPTTVFEAVGRELPIDVASLGNHELDWGIKGLHDGLGHLGFPVLCANADLGLESTAVLETSDGEVGIVGLTTPALSELHDWFDQPQPSAAETALEQAERLRSSGVKYVIVALHDGVDFAFRPEGIQPDYTRMAAFCRHISGAVDAVAGGHTLGRWIGDLEGVAFLQPWAYGAEIGLARLTPDGVRDVKGVVPAPGRPWTGFGSAMFDADLDDPIATLDLPVKAHPGFDKTLPDLVASAIRSTTGADVGLCFAQELQTSQPPIDGAIAFLPAGPVTRSEILRLFPHQRGDSYGELSIVALDIGELDRAVDSAAGSVGAVDNAINPAVWGPPSRSGQSQRATVRVAMGHQWVRRLEARLQRPLEVESTGLLLREAVEIFAADGGFSSA